MRPCGWKKREWQEDEAALHSFIRDNSSTRRTEKDREELHEEEKHANGRRQNNTHRNKESV